MSNNSALFQGNARTEFLPKHSWWVGLSASEFYATCRKELCRMVRSPLGSPDKASLGENVTRPGRPRTTHI